MKLKPESEGIRKPRGQADDAQTYPKSKVEERIAEFPGEPFIYRPHVVAGVPWCSGGYVPMDGTCKRYTVRPDEFRGRDCASYSQDQNNCPVGWLTDGGKCYVWQAATLTTTLV